MLREARGSGGGVVGVRLLDSVHIVGVCFSVGEEDFGKASNELDRQPVSAEFISVNCALVFHNMVNGTVLALSCEGKSIQGTFKAIISFVEVMEDHFVLFVSFE